MSTTEDQKNQLVQKILKYSLIEHPLMPTPNEEQRLQMIQNVGPEETMRLFLMREQRVRAELADPHRYGSELTSWQDADALMNKSSELLILGGNRAGKTEYAAKRVSQIFLGTDLNGIAPHWVKEKFGKRGLNIWCLHTTNMTSVSMQQNVFHKYLPSELKEAKRNKHTQVSWTQKNGFSDNTAVYNGNQIWFLN